MNIPLAIASCAFSFTPIEERMNNPMGKKRNQGSCTKIFLSVRGIISRRISDFLDCVSDADLFCAKLERREISGVRQLFRVRERERHVVENFTRATVTCCNFIKRNIKPSVSCGRVREKMGKGERGREDICEST